MVYSDTTTRQGLIQDCEDLTGLGVAGISGVTAKLQTFTRYINERYLEVTGLIITADGRWQWDDSNHAAQPVATTDIVLGQDDYLVLSATPSSAQDWLEVDKVELKDSNGDWYFLNPIDKGQYNTSLEERFETNGLPTYYDMEGASVKLYPASDYASTNGMKVWFKRAPLLFATSATTKKPGFASIFHKYLSLGASFDYCIANDMDRANNLKALMDEMKIAIKEHYGKRIGYETLKVKRAPHSFK